jgi:hypothetical protein
MVTAADQCVVEVVVFPLAGVRKSGKYSACAAMCTSVCNRVRNLKSASAC